MFTTRVCCEGYVVFRLYNLGGKDLYKWQKTRLKEGQKKYGNSDLDRYNLVDIMEELLDAVDILDRMINRLGYETIINTDFEKEIVKFKYELMELVYRMWLGKINRTNNEEE